MAELIVYLGIFFLVIHIVMLIICTIKPKKILWVIHLSSQVITLSALLLFLTVFLQMMIDSEIFTGLEGGVLAILVVIGMIAYGIVLALSLIIGIIRLIIWHEKKQLEPKIIS
jgi:hypothetical protein